LYLSEKPVKVELLTTYVRTSDERRKG
jgi:hypothetical protein